MFPFLFLFLGGGGRGRTFFISKREAGFFLLGPSSFWGSLEVKQSYRGGSGGGWEDGSFLSCDPHWSDKLFGKFCAFSIKILFFGYVGKVIFFFTTTTKNQDI